MIKGDWDGLVELSNRRVEGLLRQAQDEGWGVQSFDRLAEDLRGRGCRMRGRVQSFDRLRMRGRGLRMKVLIDEDRLED